MSNDLILIIEDEAPLMHVLRDSFSREGFDVITAGDSEQGIKAVESNNPNAIILDLILPNGSGYDVLKRIRNQDSTKDIPVFVATNVDSSESVLECVSNGVKDYFVKSDTSIEELVSFVKKKLATA